MTALSILAFVPGVAFAHGEDVLLYPAGTSLSLIAVLTLGIVCRIRGLGVMCSLAVAFAASLPPWFLPYDAIPAVMRNTGWGYFLIGFAPSVVAGGLVVFLFRRTSMRYFGK
ncbi:hypothetical protein LF41_2901 [Lysobacter dokdonensis DS-58]|uniref:Transmembrane protein n=1 Tax=Lysobacter dokdonensis DS-58 TaxID=1300345 RepID=A0A0A2WLV9_9GAMM|nr:hypothetical protein [Lysobacter dokdonensis]KGQ19255.1 hypothetical protein LF41_2901 [Lysobacter dokdonensis DS-58]